MNDIFHKKTVGWCWCLNRVVYGKTSLVKEWGLWMIENERDPRQTAILNGMGKRGITFMTLGRGLDFWTFLAGYLTFHVPYLCVELLPKLQLFQIKLLRLLTRPYLVLGGCACGILQSFHDIFEIRDCVQWSTHPQHLTCQSFPHAFQLKTDVESCRPMRSRQKHLAFEELMATADQQHLGAFWISPAVVVLKVMMPWWSDQHRYGLTTHVAIQH